MDIFKVLIESLVQPINIIIIAFAILTLVQVCSKKNEFGKILSKIKNKQDNPEYRNKLNRKNLETESLKINTTGIDYMDKPRKEFNEVQAKYNSWTQMITIFPLLGLLGTVLGMMPGLSEMASSGKIDILYSSLSVALTSTFFGLVASIVLKFVVSFAVDSLVDKIEAIFAEYDRQLNVLDILGNDFEDIN